MSLNLSPQFKDLQIYDLSFVHLQPKAFSWLFLPQLQHECNNFGQFYSFYWKFPCIHVEFYHNAKLEKLTVKRAIFSIVESYTVVLRPGTSKLWLNPGPPGLPLDTVKANFFCFFLFWLISQQTCFTNRLSSLFSDLRFGRIIYFVTRCFQHTNKAFVEVF